MRINKTRAAQNVGIQSLLAFVVSTGSSTWRRLVPVREDSSPPVQPTRESWLRIAAGASVRFCAMNCNWGLLVPCFARHAGRLQAQLCHFRTPRHTLGGSWTKGSKNGGILFWTGIRCSIGQSCWPRLKKETIWTIELTTFKAVGRVLYYLLFSLVYLIQITGFLGDSCNLHLVKENSRKGHLAHCLPCM